MTLDEKRKIKQKLFNAGCILVCIVCLAVAAFMFLGSNPIARHFGGDMTINLPANTKLVNASWVGSKDDSMWYLTRPMRDGESAETYKYTEDSNFGVMTGTVTLIEHKE